MDPKFQTSFIPKQPVNSGQTYRTTGGINLIVLLSFIILIVAGLSAVGLYFYQKSLVASIDGINRKLGIIRQDLQPSLIASIKRADNRIELAKVILDRHNATTLFFSLLENSTLKGVSFQSFEYKETDGGKIAIAMKGEATSYGAVAIQADQLLKNTGVLDPVFSDFSLNQFGRVLFNVRFNIKPGDFLYASSFTNNGALNVKPQVE